MDSLKKKILKTALYTSPLIAILCVAPVIIVQPIPWTIVQLGIVMLTLATMCIWLINFGLLNLDKKYFRGSGITKFRYLLSYLLVLGFVVLLKYLIGMKIRPDLDLLKFSYVDPAWVMVLSINTIVLIIQNLIIVKEKKSIIELENSRLKLRNAEAVNQKLKQQIHPHFLFNSLNILKTLTKKEPRTATRYVVRLSGFLRVALLSGNVNTVKLSEELDLCVDYLEMQKIRFRSALEYNIDVPEDVRKSGFVPPFSIQLLLENAIKHNAKSRESPLSVRIQYKEGWIEICNNRQKRNGSVSSTGMGLENLAERYQILSGDDIVIKSSDNHFLVRIKVMEYNRPSKYLAKEL